MPVAKNFSDLTKAIGAPQPAAGSSTGQPQPKGMSFQSMMQGIDKSSQNTNAAAAKKTTAGLFGMTITPPQNPGDKTSIKMPKSVFGQAHDTVKDYFGGLKNTYENALPDFGAAAESSKAKNPIAKVAEGALRATSSGINTVFAPITQAVSSLQKGASDNPAVQGIANHPVVSKILDFFNGASKPFTDWAEKHPEAAQDLGAGLNVALTAAGGAKEAEISKAVPKVAEQAADTIKGAKEAVVDTTKGAAGAVKQAVQDVGQEKAVKSTAAAWERPARTPKGFVKTKDVLTESRKKGLNPPKFLAEQGINPDMHIEDGTYATEDTAAKLRSTAGKMSSDTLRPALELADNSTPKTTVADIVKKVVADIKSSKGNVAGDVESMISKARKEGAALERKFKEGMGLVDMHDNKITYAQNAKYSPFGDTNINTTAGVNRSFGRVLAGLVEDKAPDNVPVKAFNKYLQSYYNSADYLETLNGKKAPVGIGQKIVRAFTKGAGAAIGAHFGGLPTEFAGYTIGDAVNHAIDNIPNPIRKFFLSNLKQTNPEAYQKVVKYIGDQEASRLTTPALPAPSPLGSDKNPIIPAAPTTYEAPAQSIRRDE